MPTVTVLMAANPDTDDMAMARSHVLDTARKLSFLGATDALAGVVKNYFDYNRFCLKDICASFDTDFVLKIELDSRVMNPGAWDDDFLNYDYIGAPWHRWYKWVEWSTGASGDKVEDRLLVGNGGFSLRSRRLCEAVRTLSGGWTGENEDTWICHRLRQRLEAVGIRFAPYEVAKRFAVENDVYTGQFGAHKSFIDKSGKTVLVRDLGK